MEIGPGTSDNTPHYISIEEGELLTANPGSMKYQRKHRVHPYSAYSFSNLELSNRKFRKVAWSAAVLLVGVVTALILDLLRVFK